MGTLTLEDFRDELRFVCGGISATSLVWTTDRLDRRINASYLWVSMPNHSRHPELEVRETLTLAANTATYTPTNTYYMIVGVSHAQAAVVSITDETRRTKLDPVDPREQMGILRSTSRPSLYSYWEENIVLTTVPDTASVGQGLEVHGYMQPDTLALVTDATLLKPEWDEVIVVGAEWRVWVSLNEADRAYEAKQNYGQLVNEIADIRRLHGEEWGWQTGADSSMYMRSG